MDPTVCLSISDTHRLASEHIRMPPPVLRVVRFTRAHNRIAVEARASQRALYTNVCCAGCALVFVCECMVASFISVQLHICFANRRIHSNTSVASAAA